MNRKRLVVLLQTSFGLSLIEEDPGNLKTHLLNRSAIISVQSAGKWSNLKHCNFFSRCKINSLIRMQKILFGWRRNLLFFSSSELFLSCSHLSSSATLPGFLQLTRWMSSELAASLFKLFCSHAMLIWALYNIRGNAALVFPQLN